MEHCGSGGKKISGLLLLEGVAVRAYINGNTVGYCGVWIGGSRWRWWVGQSSNDFCGGPFRLFWVSLLFSINEVTKSIAQNVGKWPT